jgi:integrase
VIGDPKSRNSRRTLGIPEFAITALKSHKLHQREERLAAGGLWANDLNLVFTTPLGEPLNPSSLTRRFRVVLTEVGVPQMRFHDLRHSCASMLIATGTHPRLIMETLGHSQVSLTMNRYSHVAPIIQREVAGRMDSIISGAI